ncbi:E motif [Dillenia turbinata]|uniref:E motif n=1 Tax=Dillenia turbinata TaxID=194707 RepID=A0AAN8WJ43_9MAGN
MAVGFKLSRQTTLICSHSLDKFPKTKKNISRISPKLFGQLESEPPEINNGVFTLTLSHPILQKIECFNGPIKQFDQIHTQLIVSGLFQRSLTASRVIKKLSSSPLTFQHSVFLFDHFEEPDAFLCNTIIRSFVKFNDPNGALNFYYLKMFGKMIFPNHYTFPILLKVCADLGLAEEGEKVHSRIVKFGFELDLFVRNSLIHFYSVCWRIGSARKVFDESWDLDLVSWNSMIDGYVKNGEVGVARRLFDEMPERDMFSWNSMLAGYVGLGDMDGAGDLFRNMPFTDVVSWNCIIDGYGRIGSVSVARDMFDRMPCRNIVSWNTMLALYARSGDYTRCLRLFDRMIEVGEPKPNEATLVSILTACASLGELEKGKWVHSYIRNNGDVKPDVLLLTALLTIFELGEIVAKRLINMYPDDIGAYVLLSNLYASEGQWDDVEKVRCMMKEKGLHKAVGSSLLHSGEFSESFVENDSVHKRNMVYSMLGRMAVQMKASCRDCAGMDFRASEATDQDDKD